VTQSPLYHKAAAAVDPAIATWLHSFTVIVCVAAFLPLVLRSQVLLLNGSHDRETSTSGFHSGAMRASDVVTAVTDALNRRRSRPVS
jgi:hypothetical protein